MWTPVGLSRRLERIAVRSRRVWLERWRYERLERVVGVCWFEELRLVVVDRMHYDSGKCQVSVKWRCAVAII